MNIKSIEKQHLFYKKKYDEYCLLTPDRLKEIYQENANLTELKKAEPEKYKGRSKMSKTQLEALIAAANHLLTLEKDKIIEEKVEEIKTKDNE